METHTKHTGYRITHRCYHYCRVLFPKLHDSSTSRGVRRCQTDRDQNLREEPTRALFERPPLTCCSTDKRESTPPILYLASLPLVNTLIARQSLTTLTNSYNCQCLIVFSVQQFQEIFDFKDKRKRLCWKFYLLLCYFFVLLCLLYLHLVLLHSICAVRYWTTQQTLSSVLFGNRHTSVDEKL